MTNNLLNDDVKKLGHKEEVLPPPLLDFKLSKDKQRFNPSSRLTAIKSCRIVLKNQVLTLKIYYKNHE